MPIFVRWRRFFVKHQWVPSSKSGIFSAALTAAGIGAAAFTGQTIIPGVLTAAGAATESAAGVPVGVATNTSSGVGTASFVGSGILTGVLSSSGLASSSLVGVGVGQGVFSSSGIGSAQFGTEFRQIISRNILQNPVDCVLAGQQEEFKKGRASIAVLKRIFRE